MRSMEVELADRRRGRVFFNDDHAPSSIDAIRPELERTFAEAEDLPRLDLLERALEWRMLDVETFPSDDGAPFLHAYVHAFHLSAAPLLACVIAPASAIRELVSEPPHFVFETATFQCVDGDGMPRGAQVVDAMRAWARRVWPGRSIPRVVVRPWLERAGSDLEAMALPGLRAA